MVTQTQIGFRVACRDGWGGTLKRLVVSPGSGEITYLVIEMRSSFARAIVPAKYLSGIGYEAVFLNLTSDQLEAYSKGK